MLWMNINRDTHYLFRMTNMEDEDKHRYTTYSGWQTWKMNIHRDKLYLFRMTNMEDEHTQIYTLLIQDEEHGR